MGVVCGGGLFLCVIEGGLIYGWPSLDHGIYGAWLGNGV
jgi:hypothetical protein